MRRFVLFIFVLGLFAGAFWMFGRHETTSHSKPLVVDGADAIARGAAAFEGAAFGGLSMKAMDSHAVPWKLVASALVLEAQSNDPDLPSDLNTLDRALARFGFLVGAEIANRPDGVLPAQSLLPIGMTYGDLAPIAGAKVQVSNLGCSACHTGVTYGADGAPDPSRAWMGMPNTSINLEAYTLGIFHALKTALDDTEALMTTVQTLFPETGWTERKTLAWLVIPLIKERLAEIKSGRPLPFPNGVPGSTNGVAALKYVFGVPLFEDGPGDAGIVSIPDLGHRIWRSSLLVDGAYAVPGTERQASTVAKDDTFEKREAFAAITTFFTVPSMGVHPDTAIENIALAKDIFAFLGDTYAPQPFPGDLDLALAREGQRIFETSCSGCHGVYLWEDEKMTLMEFPNWLGDVGSDPLRAMVFSDALVDQLKTTTYADTIAVSPTQKYAAPPLTGIWASAPYLHNGSVPTIEALLTPEIRPEIFELGGHALDFERLGIRLINGRYPEGYQPFSDPVLFDTRMPGQGNGGHLFGSELSAEDKRALIEFLKRL